MDWVHVSRHRSEVLKTKRRASDLVLVRDKEFYPEEKARDLATNEALEIGTSEARTRRE